MFTEDSDPESVKPKVLWSLFFSQVDTSVCDDEALAAGLPSNVLVTAGPGTAVGFEHAVAQVGLLSRSLGSIKTYSNESYELRT